MSVLQKLRKVFRVKPKVVKLEPVEPVCEKLDADTPQTVGLTDDVSDHEEMRSEGEVEIKFFTAAEDLQKLREIYAKEVDEILGLMIMFDMLDKYRKAERWADEYLYGASGERVETFSETLSKLSTYSLWIFLQDIRFMVGRRIERDPPREIVPSRDYSLSA